MKYACSIPRRSKKPSNKDGGTPIVYSIMEDTAGDYETTYNGYNVTNRLTPGKTSVSVTKSWQDSNNQDGVRPNEITVKLLADGADTGKTLTLNAGNNWTGTFGELAEYKNGVKVVYTVEEVAVKDYARRIESSGSPQAALPLKKAFLVLADRTAFLLRVGTEDCYEQFSVCTHGMEVLSLKVDMHTERFQFPNRIQQRNRITGETGN